MDILLRATVLMSFILLEVLSIVVDDTGIVIVPIRIDSILGNACWNGKTSKYRSIIFFDLNGFNIGFSTWISLFNKWISDLNITHEPFNSSVSKNVELSGDNDEIPRRIYIIVFEKRSFISRRIESITGLKTNILYLFLLSISWHCPIILLGYNAEHGNQKF